MMASVHYLPAITPPMPAVVRILARFDRERLAGFIEVAIGLLDALDPDPDAEDSEGGGNLVDARGRFIGENHSAKLFDDDCEPDDEDCEHDGREDDDYGVV